MRGTALRHPAAVPTVTAALGKGEAGVTSGGSARAGIAWMLLATLLFTTMDSLSKYLTQIYPVMEVAWARFAFHTLFAFALMAPRLPVLLRSRWRTMQIVRSLLLFTATCLMFVALSRLPLLLVITVMTLSPVLVTALSAPILKEKVGWRRWAGVGVALCGAMLVVGPAGLTLSLLVLVPMLCALVNALYMITTRMLHHHDPPVTTLLYTGMVGTVLGLPVMPFVWVPPDMAGWLLLAVLGALGAISHFCMIRAYSAAPASVIAPFVYATLVWAAVSGAIFFGEVPGWTTVAGACIIAGSGLYIFYREQVRARQQA